MLKAQDPRKASRDSERNIEGDQELRHDATLNRGVRAIKYLYRMELESSALNNREPRVMDLLWTGRSFGPLLGYPM